MKRRALIAGLAVLAIGIVAGAVAFAWGGPGHRSGVMKRFVAAAVDDAIDQAGVTAEQRAAIHAARDRVWTSVEQHRLTRGSQLEDALRLFEAERVDPGQVATLRQAHEAEHRQLADSIAQAILEVHDILTPAQRKALADYVRAHRPRGI
jgi:Spy/CpxP family protein refolding chaperone